MGFSDLIDLAGSILIGGLIMLILFRMNDAAVENVYNNGGELNLQQNLSVTARVLENDFRKIGYCANWQKIPDPSKSILLADSNRIKFLTDIDKNGSGPDGVVDTMYYYLGPTSELTQTPNPRDRLLYRVVNNETPRGVNLGVTQFKLVYFDALGDTINFPITVPSEVYSLEINISVENVAGYDEKYSSAFWRQVRLVARNLRNR
jgi:type II secretory pathway component PulJ